MELRRIMALLLATPIVLAGLSAAGSRRQNPKAETATKAVAVLKQNCAPCHNGSLFFDANHFQTLVKKGYLKAGDINGSLALQRVLKSEMPPAGPLTDADKAVLRQWVIDGALDPSAAATVVVETTPQGKPAATPPPAVKVRSNIGDAELLTAIVRDLEAADERERPYPLPQPPDQ
jgi:hypothetical protein